MDGPVGVAVVAGAAHADRVTCQHEPADDGRFRGWPMADYGDYFDLVARAVARVEADTTAARQRIYEYARHAQSMQLQNFDPRIGATAIQHERSALEEAIRRIEIAALEQPTIIETWQMLLEPEAEELTESPRGLGRLIGSWRRSRA